MEWSWHVNSGNSNDISWGASSCVASFGQYLHSSWYVTNWYLFTWLLDFDFLETNKSARFNLHNQLSFSLISFTFSTWALNFRSEFSCINNLIYFKSANITSIHSYLNAWLNIRYSSYYTLNIDKSSNTIRSDISHSLNSFLSLLSINYKHLICSFKFRWQHHFRVSWHLTSLTN